MTGASLRLNGGCAIALDPIRETSATQRGILLSLQGRVPGSVMNCAVIPLERVPELLATLQMVADQARQA